MAPADRELRIVGATRWLVARCSLLLWLLFVVFFLFRVDLLPGAVRQADL